MLCHSVRSCHSPLLSLKRSLVASVSLATGVPLVVYLTSGSLPRLPMRITLLTLFPAMGVAPYVMGLPEAQPGRPRQRPGEHLLGPVEAIYQKAGGGSCAESPGIAVA